MSERSLPRLRLRHDVGESLELLDVPRDQSLWKYVYSGGKPKPFFHPIHTPAGHCVTLCEPHDHPWHRGLWFTIKFVNDDNFWEEREPMGRQKLVIPPSVEHGRDGEIVVRADSEWVGPRDSRAVIAERRTLTWSSLRDDAYAKDFDMEQTAQRALKFDRVPFTTWGGYGGLIFRGNRNWQETRLLFADGSTSDRPTGQRALWCDLAGKFDGGVEQTGGVAIFDHPANVRHPSPWYGSTGPGHYINAAFLFHEPLHVDRGQTLRLRYRVLVHDGMWDIRHLRDAYDGYVTRASAGNGST
jgi:hypothetical protein